MLKLVTSSGSNVSLTIPGHDSNENPDNNVELQEHTEEISLYKQVRLLSHAI